MKNNITNQEVEVLSKGLQNAVDTAVKFFDCFFIALSEIHKHPELYNYLKYRGLLNNEK